MLTKPADPKIDALRDVFLFRGCTARELKHIASLVGEIEVPAGRVLARQGRPGRECFIALEGTARVSLADGSTVDLGAGDVFGEMALIDQGPRSATVETLTAMRLLVLDPRAFSALMAEHRSVASKILQALVERLRVIEGAPTTWAASG